MVERIIAVAEQTALRHERSHLIASSIVEGLVHAAVAAVNHQLVVTRTQELDSVQTELQQLRVNHAVRPVLLPVVLLCSSRLAVHAVHNAADSPLVNAAGANGSIAARRAS